MSDIPASSAAGDRLAKVIARSGLCSRRDAEGWIKDGRVTVNGRKVLTPAFNVSERDKVAVDGEPLAARQGTRVWLYHKPPGLVVTEKDPEGRETIFDHLDELGLPRVVSIGRLDINTEGLLLLTNDGGLKRVLELPATGWLRRYRVRAFGSITQQQLDALKEGIEIDGIQYGPIDAILEREQGSNVWLVLSLREGKNREVKNVLGELGLQVNRLIRVSFGPFQLGDIDVGKVETVPARVLREQLGKRLAAEANTDFESEMPEIDVTRPKAVNPNLRASAPGKPLSRDTPRRDVVSRFRFEDGTSAERNDADRPAHKGRPGRFEPARPSRPVREPEVSQTRRVFFEDGTQGEIKLKPKRRDDEDRGDRPFGKRPPRDGGKPAFDGGKRGPRPDWAERPKRGAGDRQDVRTARGDRPQRDFPDRPKRDFGDRPKRDFSAGPKREFGDRPQRGPRPEGAAPRREFGDRPQRGPRPDGGAPQRSYGGKPAGDRPARGPGDKPGRQYQGKPGGKPGGFDRAAKPGGYGKPGGFDKSGKPGGFGKPGGRPTGGRPGAGRPGGARPDSRGPRPDGGAPRGPKKPRS